LFTAEQEEKITEIVARFPRIQSDGPNQAVKETENSNRVARLQFLAQYLSEDQLLYYKLDREGRAPLIERLLQGMQPTKDEFLGVAKAMEGKDTDMTNGVSQPSLIDSLQNILSPDRFALLSSLQQPEYRALFNFARTYHLPTETISSLVEIRRKKDTQDPQTYRKQVATILKPAPITAVYLADKAIHPDSTVK
jgi:hypothetical protein